jgi:hypothetical protein
MDVTCTKIRRLIGIVSIMATTVGTAALAGTLDSEDEARVRRAITYLDGRQDSWSRFGRAERGEANDRTTCVSCHTGISYALARHSLRPYSTSEGPAVAEERMVQAVVLRVEHWSELDSPRFRLMYDSDDRKKTESLGTEAVFNALILARNDVAQARETAGAATHAALRHLWATQLTAGSDAGSWDWLNFGLEPWEADGSRPFGAALAAIAASSAPGYLDGPMDEKPAIGVRLLREYLRGRFPKENLHNRLWILEASSKFAGLLSARQKREVLDQLLAVQQDDGGWALATFGSFERVDGTPQAGKSDGYATGLALHALLRTGPPAEPLAVDKGRRWLLLHQNEDGSWPGYSMNKERDPTTFVGKLMPDAATAMASRALVDCILLAVR